MNKKVFYSELQNRFPGLYEKMLNRKFAFILIIVISILSSCNDHQLSSQQDKQAITDSSSPTVKDMPPVQDEQEIARLMKKVHKLKDKITGDEWIEPVNAPQYVNQNAIYAYFPVSGSTPTGLRLKIQYVADDWLFIRNYVFNIDGTTYNYIPNEVKTDNGGGIIWEWSDQAMINENKKIIEGLANAKSAKIRFQGRDYQKDKIVTASQLQNIKIIYDLYNAMGGNFDY
jgi:hypothetical protein